MKRFPSWMLWGLTVVILWCVWGWIILGPMRRYHRDAKEQLIALDRQRLAVLSGLSVAPAVVAQVDSMTAALRRITSGFTRTDAVEALIDGLQATARSAGVRRAAVDPDLVCLMGIPAAGERHGEAGITLEVLRVDLSAAGSFAALGTWLDNIESRSDFRQWSVCEWAKGEEDGTVHFSGRAAFWVVVPTERQP